MSKTTSTDKPASADKPRIHVTNNGSLYVDAEELLRSEEVQRVMREMARIPVERTSSDQPAEPDHKDTKG